MKQKEAMMSVVVAALILAANRQAAAQPTAGVHAGSPGHELIDLTPHNGIAGTYAMANLYAASTGSGSHPGASSRYANVDPMPVAADSGVFMSTDQSWSQPYNLFDLAAAESTGFDTAEITGMQNYAAGALGAPVPEPASVAMLLAGLAALAALDRRRAQRAE
jgi:hypothetical protein